MGFMIVNKETGRYYAGILTIKGQQVPQWVFHPKSAKVYATLRWARKTAQRWGGIVEEMTKG